MPRVLIGDVPPRPIGVGDVIAGYSDELGEWTAAQITDLNPSWKMAGVLELAWSGPKPASVTNLGQVEPLILTHHAWAGKPAHDNRPWVLPRSFDVIGRLPLLRSERSNLYTSGWDLGTQLALQRRWDRGDRASPTVWPGAVQTTGSEIGEVLHEVRNDVWSLKVQDVVELDASLLVSAFPRLRRLALRGKLGKLANAGQLNRLTELKILALSNLFGMSKADCLLPEATPSLEWLALYSVPREYGSAMRSAWRGEVANGCFLDISALRSPVWLAENMDNPLRDWDGRENISAAKFAKAVAQYKATRRAVLSAFDAMSTVDMESRMIELGKEFGEAFNRLSRRDDFIETEEREELFAALTTILDSVEATDLQRQQVGEWLARGLDEVRDW